MLIFKVYAERNGRWSPIPFAEGTLAYCNGWVDAMDSLYPSNPHKIMKFNNKTGEFLQIRETKGRGIPHVNA